jgi:hypothetical protein
LILDDKVCMAAAVELKLDRSPHLARLDRSPHLARLDRSPDLHEG